MMETAEDKRRQKHNEGYTMVELIVVVVITMIVAGGLVFGAVKWSENIRFQRQNEYARTIFTAAQNQLTEYSESGQLEKMQKALCDASGDYDRDHVVNAAKLLDKHGEAYDPDTLWPESKKGGESSEKYRGEIYSLKGTPGDYAEYKAGTADEKIKVLYDMLTPYLYSTDILAEGVVCLEFTPGDGQVFAALYSDIAGDFTYRETDDRRGTVSIQSRKTSSRRKRMVGYYGVDTLYKASGMRAKKPSISDLKLNNEETLNLSFQINKAKDAVQELQYEVTVYEGSGKARLAFVLDGKELRNKEFTAGKRIDCEVKRYQYKESGVMTTQELGRYPILAWLEASGGKPVVRIVLDGADQAATTALYQQVFKQLTDAGENSAAGMNSEYVTKFIQTQSFRRFGLVGVEDIYCTVRGTGADYKPTAKKQSNTENAAFGQAAVSGDGTSVEYTLQNARHLYNVRYLEDYTDTERWIWTGEGIKSKTGNALRQETAPHMDGGASQYKTITYKLGETIDWSAFAAEGNLFEAGVVQTEGGDTGFPSIRQLRKNSTLTGGAEDRYTISGLDISAAYNHEEKLYRTVRANAVDTETSQEAQLAAGLFLKNEGEISNLSLDRITVEGGTDVGAFCGQNKGVLSGLSVKNSGKGSAQESVICGVRNVGGITGVQLANADESKKTALTKLTNAARVAERDDIDHNNSEPHRNFGGIVGELKTDTASGITVLQVIDCENYGVVTAAWAQGKPGTPRETENIGGITGNAVNDGNKLELRNCISSPRYTAGEIQAILSGDERERSLYGNRTGGIVGYNAGAVLKGCGTKSGNEAGYVIGGVNVGGIIGYNEEKTAAVSGGEAGGEKGVNEAHVLGRESVGGIVGGNPGSTVENWENKGVVAATGKYAGGITGYNGALPGAPVPERTAGIRNCLSNVAGTEVARAVLAEESLFHADYTGGITGYNNAEIKADREIQLAGNVAGADFVGGIAGYNDVDGVIENYSVTGGCIEGTGVGVGGFCGLNASIRLLEDAAGNAYYVHAAPEEVKGGFCVGGVIGENIIPLPAGKTTVNCGFSTGGFLGKLTASGAYAGGYIGGSQMVRYQDGIRESIWQAAESFADQCAADLASGEMTGAGWLLDSGNFQGTDGKFVIKGEGAPQNMDRAQTARGSITARIYAGGVIGCNQPGTGLLVQNVENRTAVEATGSVEDEAGRTDHRGAKFRYSYAGGIIGKVSDRVVLDNCRNQESGLVVSAGTCTGGLCEVNEGTIIKCTVQDLRAPDKDYVGGIAGINRGIIQECKMEAGRTVEGLNLVGGIAAENAGTIVDTTVEGKICGAGYVGGITARNKNTIKQCTIASAEITGREDCHATVGGVAGVNEENAQIESISIGTGGDRTYQLCLGAPGADLDKTAAYSVHVCAQGSGHAGGVAGQNSGKIQMVESSSDDGGRQTPVSSAAVESNGGHAGGIVGDSQNGSQILNVQTGADWTVYAAGNGQKLGCGGIVGRQAGKGELQDCVNRARVVMAAGSGCTGGVIGLLAEPAGDDASAVAGCQNHGHINGGAGHAAGIVAGSAQMTVKVVLENCVNTGRIRGTTTAGISTLGTLGAPVSTDSKVIYCRNYGYASDEKNMGGILAESAATEMTVRGCLNVSSLPMPIAPEAALDDASGFNYYITQEGEPASREGTGEPAYAVPVGENSYKLVCGENPMTGQAEFRLNPYQVYADASQEALDDDSLKTKGNNRNNIRYQIFEADDAAFFEILKEAAGQGDGER